MLSGNVLFKSGKKQQHVNTWILIRISDLVESSLTYKTLQMPHWTFKSCMMQKFLWNTKLHYLGHHIGSCVADCAACSALLAMVSIHQQAFSQISKANVISLRDSQWERIHYGPAEMLFYSLSAVSAFSCFTNQTHRDTIRAKLNFTVTTTTFWNPHRLTLTWNN